MLKMRMVAMVSLSPPYPTAQYEIKQNDSIWTFWRWYNAFHKDIIAVTLVHYYWCVIYKVFARSVSHCSLQPCEVDGLVAISQMRELKLQKMKYFSYNHSG